MAKTTDTAVETTSSGREAAKRAEPELLGIYLNDHLAGATGGSELASRVARARRGSEDGGVLKRLATEIREDRTALVELMAALAIPVQHYKVALGWAAEKIGRLKPNGHLLTRSPLSDLEELEAMRLGVEGKTACWQMLRLLAEHDDRLDGPRLDRLLRRADRQAKTLEGLRARATADFMGMS